MTEFHVAGQQARLIQNADIVVNAGAPATDHRVAAENALRARDYESAITHLKHVLMTDPADPLARYRLVLAALRGRHPDRYGARQIHDLTARLVRLVTEYPDCHHARALALVINDGMVAGGPSGPPAPGAGARRLIALVDPDRAREIVLHVDVPGSPVRALLSRRAERSSTSPNRQEF
ncbi:hypothetical protein ACIREE_31965 [Streptomyces sp. NPDC102467]|uniref:hypothetical protein n=1 Tax=Streptomyces sp. NPDC102467 TaxID=3366179 RepID=UPI003823D160